MEQHLPGLGREFEIPALRMCLNIALFLKNFNHLPNLRTRNTSHDSVGGKPIQMKLLNSPVSASAKNARHQRRTQRIAQMIIDPLNTGENHLGIAGDIAFHCFRFTVGTVFAFFRVLLSEVIQNIAPQTMVGIAIANHGIKAEEFSGNEAAAFFFGEFFIFRGMLDQIFCRADIRSRIQQNAFRVFAISAGASGLLIVGFDALGHIIVNHISNIGFVDAHTKGIGCNHHPSAVINKIVLIDPAFFLG